MEETKKRIQFQNRGIQIQAIRRVYQEVEKKKPDASPITEDSPEISELGVLLDGLCGSDSFVAQLSGDALLRLVQNGALHYGRALNMLLAAAPSVRSVSATVRVLYQLMVTEALATVAAKGSYTCPYGLRSRPHPMITVLTHRPESWHSLAQEMDATFRHRDPRVRDLAVELVLPVVSFLLAEPQSGDTFTSARRGVTRVLIRQLLRPDRVPGRSDGDQGEWADASLKVELVRLLLRLLPQSQVDSPDQVIFASGLLEDLCRAVRLNLVGAPAREEDSLSGDKGEVQMDSRAGGAAWQAVSAQTFTMGLEALLECLRADVVFSSLAVEMLRLVAVCPEAAMHHADINLLLFGELLDSPLVYALPEIITLAHAGVRACPPAANYLCLASLLKPLLHVLATPNDVAAGGRSQSEAKVRAGETLGMVQERLAAVHVALEQEQTLPPPAPSACLSSIGQKALFLRDLCLALTGDATRRDDHGSARRPDWHRPHQEQTARAGQPTSKLEKTGEGSRPEGQSGGRLQGVEARLVTWARGAASSLELRQGRPAGGANVSGGRSTSPGGVSRIARLACAVLLTATSEAVAKAAADLLLILATLEPAKALDFLPVILHALGRNPRPETRLTLLEALPDLATHKYCVSPILKIVLALYQSAAARALSVRLMTRLWKQQDRCFPQLLKILTERGPQGVGQESHDVLLAKAAAILEVCRLKPEKHGAELLAPLSRILEESSSRDQGTAASCLLVDGLYLLCQAEVMDLRSLWTVLGPRLGRGQERRPLVVARVCRLLSLVPELAVDSEDYQIFSADTVRMLWESAQDDCPSVRRAALQALASFPADQFRVSYLPAEITEYLRRQAQVASDQARSASTGGGEARNEGESATDDEITVDQLFPEVPASCYTALLKTSVCREEETVTGFQEFLKSMVAREAASLPRGLYFSSTSRKQAQAAQTRGGAAVDGVPRFLQQQLDKCKKPGLRPSIAAGLLFCYDPPVETGRDGRQFIARHSKMFMQMFNTLLQEVPIHPSDWHLCSLLPDAWSGFMQRLFTAVLEGRRAQLDFQSKQGNLSATDFAEAMSVAWLWSRDSIVDVIRTASRGSLSAQANSVLSLAGLSLCVLRHAAGLDPAALEAAEEGRSEFTGHARWQLVACDTVLSLVDVQYRPKAGLLGLCQQMSTLDRVPACPAVSAVACAAIGQLVPVFMARALEGGTDTLLQILADLSVAQNSSSSSSSSPNAGRDAGEESSGRGARSSEGFASQFDAWNGLALGLLLRRLFEEHFSQSTGSKGMLAVWRALSALEKACLVTSTTPPCDAPSAGPGAAQGCVLGLGLALRGLCNDGRTESRVHVVSTLEKLHQTMARTPVHDNLHEVLCYAVTMVTAAVHTSNATTEDVVTPLLHKLLHLHRENRQRTGLSLSFGLLVSAVGTIGNSEAAQLTVDTARSWLKDLSTEEIPADHKISKVVGLLSMLASERSSPQASSVAASSGVNMSETIGVISKIVSTDYDLDLTKVAAWMLGHFHLTVSSSELQGQFGVPQTYSYLPETSFLRAAVDFLLETGRSGIIPDSQVCAVLQALNVGRALPPLDWASLLSPLMRVINNEHVRTLSLQVAASQMNGSPSAATFVSGWLTPPLVNSLTMVNQAALHRCMPDIIRSVSPAVLKLYLERSCHQAFADLKFEFTTATQARQPGNGHEQKGTVSACCAPGSSDQGLAHRASGQDQETRAASHNVVISILTGLRDALAIDDPPQSVTLLLYEAAGRFYQLLPVGTGKAVSALHLDLLRAMAAYLAELPDDVLDSILVADFQDSTTQLRGSFMRCYLVSLGRQPISLLNIMVDAAFNVPEWKQSMGVGLLLTCLASMPQEEENETRLSGQGQGPVHQWLSELLGHTASIAAGAWPLSDSAPDLGQVTLFLVDVVTCVLLALTSPGCEDLALWAMDLQLFTAPQRRMPPPGVDVQLDGERTKLSWVKEDVPLPQFDVLMKESLNYLPLAVQAVSSNRWALLRPKVVDWLITMLTLDTVGDRTKDVLLEALLSLRHTQEFRQASVWTKAVSFSMS